jgi:hypothetical protein
MNLFNLRINFHIMSSAITVIKKYLISRFQPISKTEVFGHDLKVFFDFVFLGKKLAILQKKSHKVDKNNLPF